MSNPSTDTGYAMVDIYRSTTTAVPNTSRNVLDSFKLFVANVGSTGTDDSDEKEAFLDMGPISRLDFLFYSIWANGNFDSLVLINLERDANSKVGDSCKKKNDKIRKKKEFIVKSRR